MVVLLIIPIEAETLAKRGLEKFGWYNWVVKVLLPCGEGDTPLDCPHQFVGICSDCRSAGAPNEALGRPAIQPEWSRKH